MESWLVRAVRMCPLAVASDLGICTNKFSGEAGSYAKKSGINCLDPGAGYGAKTYPVEVSDDIMFFIQRGDAVCYCRWCWWGFRGQEDIAEIVREWLGALMRQVDVPQSFCCFVPSTQIERDDIIND